MHICASRPQYVSRSDVPDEVREAREAELNGKIEKFYDESVLLEQPYVRDETQTVADLINGAIATLGENIKVRRFARFDIGEG